MSAVWPYVTPGIPDHLFEQLPGIPMSQREVRLLLLGYLRLRPDAVLWDIGAGTGTIAVEAGLICPRGKVVAVERDEDVARLIQANCERFGVTNVEVVVGNAPECFDGLPYVPTCVLIEGGRSYRELLMQVWEKLSPEGHIAVTASNFEALYAISETFAKLQVRNVEVAQPTVNRLETRGNHQVLKSVDPIFILSGDKLG
ncbi:MAG: precorrin-6Y C5,15-methyltransferase subunit CbiT [Cyanobacteria bacterium P01_F01_bin.4]